MHSASTNGCCVMFCIICFIFYVLPFCNANLISSQVLNVGKELLKETLPLRKGFCIYQLQGLKSKAWYEVKISYPASIPASFSLQLKRGDSEVGMKQQRRLLNTEKLIFKSDDLDLLNNQGGLFVLVTVESEGVVAIPHAKEREDIIFNIVCDELWLGVPQKAWWVIILVIICLGLALAVPSFLPAYLLQPNRNPPLHHSEIVFKSS